MADGHRERLRGRLERRAVGKSNLVRVGAIWLAAAVITVVVAIIIPSLTLVGAIGLVAALATLADIAYFQPQPDPPGAGPPAQQSETAATPNWTTKLNAQGFERLDQDDFENRTVDRAYCWRRPFNFTEIAEDIPLDRQRPTDNRPTVTSELLADLEDGGGALLVGEPGAGKTTTTRQVAAAWYDRDDVGPVIYREQRIDLITDSADLATALAEPS
jgi:hypothetical protein